MMEWECSRVDVRDEEDVMARRRDGRMLLIQVHDKTHIRKMENSRKKVWKHWQVPDGQLTLRHLPLLFLSRYVWMDVYSMSIPRVGSVGVGYKEDAISMACGAVHG